MKHIYQSTLFFIVLTIAFSCSDEDIIDRPKGEDKTVNQWIYDKMDDYYLWYDEMPSEANAKFNFEPESFFYSLLSNKDGKTYSSSSSSSGQHYYYSYIHEKTGTKAYMGEEPSFGFEYQAWNISISSTTSRIGLQVLYVLPNSPAEGYLKRGDWIFQINGSNVGNNYYELINSSTTLNFGVADNMSSYNKTLRYTGNLTKTMIEDNPVFVKELFQSGNHKVGYMAYNHFTTGTQGSSDHSFDDDMLESIENLANQGATEFILDLRYNGGGYVTSAQKMASYLVPDRYLNNIFCKMSYNDKKSSDSQDLKFISTKHSGLNLKRLFVITSSRTASASELVIAGLIPYIGKENIIIVGETTEGKNVGSREFEDDDYDWILQPIVCYVTNSDELKYSDGFKPTANFRYYYSTEAGLNSLYDLGNRNEEILKAILEFISTEKNPDSQTWIEPTKSSSIDIIPLTSSLDRKRTNGVILN